MRGGAERTLLVAAVLLGVGPVVVLAGAGAAVVVLLAALARVCVALELEAQRLGGFALAHCGAATRGVGAE